MNMNPVQTLDNAMTTLVGEIFQNGREEGNRIWGDVSHPLHQAIRILLRAQLQLQSNEEGTLIQKHCQMEEGSASHIWAD